MFDRASLPHDEEANPGGIYTSTLSLPGFRSEYSVVPPHEGFTTTKPNQIGVSFSAHRNLVQQHEGVERQCNVAFGAAFVTGAEPITWLRVHEQTEALEIYPDDALVREIAERDVVFVSPSLGRRDPVVLSIASTLRCWHCAGAPIGETAASELGVRLATHLVERYSDVRLPSNSGALDFARVRRVCDYIEAHYASEIAIGDLARVVGLSPAHFSRAFKAATGLSPHKFVTMRRLSAAREIVARSEQTVDDIAHRVGFSNLSHFRRLFRAQFGAPPYAFRS
jgi:AraC family transcriptional regulator